MPTRVLLEGPAIEPLLAQVRQEYGPSARIISADKIRTGGLGGFFARQRYELSIQIDDDAVPAPPSPAAPTAAAPAGGPVEPLDALLALVEATNDRPKGRPDKSTPATPAEPARPARAKTPTKTASPPRAGLVSTANPDFAEILAGLQGGLDGVEADATTAPPTGAARRAEPTTTSRAEPTTTSRAEP
ncbi:MAG TPA: hypothetical protein VFT95_14280, partial [Micromonosporaceae bacterium]|nr:hypothetical protein [Micromonosporaceae bacterium]